MSSFILLSKSFNMMARGALENRQAEYLLLEMKLSDLCYMQTWIYQHGPSEDSRAHLGV